MSAILGIDAAWTPEGPSGVALIRKAFSGGWESVKVEAGYSAFLPQLDRPLLGIERRLIPAQKLIRYAEEIAETSLSLVVADIPLSREPITGLRFADKEVSRRFGKYGCATHTPNSTRQGVLGENFRDLFGRCGFPFVTSAKNFPDRALIETYPHPVLLSLLGASYRVKYKVSKNKKYWPTEEKSSRKINLVRAFREIHGKLSSSISNVNLEIPEKPSSFSALKPIEDKIDALVCAWVGIQVLDGKAEPIGDESAAIWLPQSAE